MDDTRRYARLGEDLVYNVVGVGRCGGRLPDNNVSDEGGGRRKIAADGSKVKWRNSEYEPLETTILDTTERNQVRSRLGANQMANSLPYARRVLRGLLSIQLLNELNAKPQEIRQLHHPINISLSQSNHKTHLGSGIDLRLPRILPLPKHRSRHKLVPILPTNEVCRAQEDRSTVRPWQRLPFVSRRDSTFDRGRDLLGTGFVVCAEVVRVVVRHGLFGDASGFDLDIVRS